VGHGVVTVEQFDGDVSKWLVAYILKVMHQNVAIAESEKFYLTPFVGNTRDLALGAIFNYPLHDLPWVSRNPKVVDGVAVEWCPLARFKGKLPDAYSVVLK
jgi:hypothetical protein